MAVLEGQNLTQGKVISLWTCNIPISPQNWISNLPIILYRHRVLSEAFVHSQGLLLLRGFHSLYDSFYNKCTQIHFLNRNKSYSLWNNTIFDITNSLHINSLVCLTWLFLIHPLFILFWSQCLVLWVCMIR